MNALGLHAETLAPGQARVWGTIRPEFLNSWGSAHGGISGRGARRGKAVGAVYRHGLSEDRSTHLTFGRPLNRSKDKFGSANKRNDIKNRLKNLKNAFPPIYRHISCSNYFELAEKRLMMDEIKRLDGQITSVYCTFATGKMVVLERGALAGGRQGGSCSHPLWPAGGWFGAPRRTGWKGAGPSGAAGDYPGGRTDEPVVVVLAAPLSAAGFSGSHLASSPGFSRRRTENRRL